jgi:hypothetical protein
MQLAPKEEKPAMRGNHGMASKEAKPSLSKAESTAFGGQGFSRQSMRVNQEIFSN